MTLVLALGACSSDGGSEEPTADVRCEPVQVEATDYCVYAQPITETGYDCPADLPNGIPFEGGTVCAGGDDIPPEHAEPIREQMGGGSSPTVAQICANPALYDGQQITVSASDVATYTTGTAVGCDCCNRVVSDYVIACDRTAQDNIVTDTAIVLIEAEEELFDDAVGRVEAPTGSALADLISNPGDSTVSFGCIGQECYQICTPGRLSELTSFTGTLRATGGPHSTGKGEQYTLAIEVAAVERAGDGCPDFASSCPAGCTEITGTQYRPEDGCHMPSRVIGCTDAQVGTAEEGCVKRGDGAYPYTIPSASMTDGTDWVACTDAEATEAMGDHPTCP